MGMKAKKEEEEEKEVKKEEKEKVVKKEVGEEESPLSFRYIDVYLKVPKKKRKEKAKHE